MLRPTSEAPCQRGDPFGSESLHDLDPLRITMPSLLKRLTAAAGAVAGLLIAASAPAHAQTAEGAVRSLIEGIDASDKWTAAAGQFTPSGNGVTASNIRITGEGDSNVSIEIGNLTVTGYSEPG